MSLLLCILLVIHISFCVLSRWARRKVLIKNRWDADFIDIMLVVLPIFNIIFFFMNTDGLSIGKKITSKFFNLK